MTRTSTTAPGPSSLCELVTAQGLPRALDTLVASRVADDGDIPWGPGGHAVVPASALTDAQRETCLHLIALAQPQGGTYEVAVLGRPPGRPPLEQPASWCTAVVWLRLGISRRFLTHTVRRLGERRSADRVLLTEQMVQASLADALAEQLEAEALLSGEQSPPESHVAAEASRRIAAADRQLRHLAGAYGFESGGVGTALWVSELLADAYVPDPLDDGGNNHA